MDDDNVLDPIEYSKIEDKQSDQKETKLVRWRIVQQADGPSPRPRHGHRAVPIKDVIVVLGGGNEGMIDELHVFNTQKNEWVAPQMRGELPSPCAAFGAVALGTSVFTFGGMVEYGKYSNELNELQATRWEWRRLNPRSSGDNYPRARLGHSFVASQKTKKAYVFGGLVNDLNESKRNVPHYMNDFYVIDLSVAPANLQWEQPQTHGTPPCARESHTAVLYETDTRNVMVVYGGMNGTRLGDLWYLDLDTYNWREVKASCGIPPMPRSLHTSVLIGDKMYIYGGWIPLSEASGSEQTEKEWKCTSSMGCWDVNEERWVPLQFYTYDEDTIPRGRSGHCAAAVGSRMYIWSGRDGYRKAWSNQVCCRDMWFLETVKPEQPGKVQLTRAGFQALEVTWQPVQSAEAYLLQIGFGDPKEASLSPMKESARDRLMRAQTTPRKQAVQIGMQKETESPKKIDGSTASLISTQGTTYTAPVSSKPAPDEGGLPQDLFEDSEKNETAISSPKHSSQTEVPATASSGEAHGENKIGESPSKEATENEKDVEKKLSEEDTKPGETNEDDDLPWFDVGLIDKNIISVSHYFSDHQERLEKQLSDLIDQNACKCINDEVYTVNDKVPLLSGQSYRFRVAAVNGLGRGPFSESSSFKTCLPGYPSAPSSIRITKSADGAQLTWEPPGNTTISGKIVEYSVYLAVKNQNSNSADSQLAFMRVYCGPTAECQVPQASLATAYVDQTNKPAIIFRIAARNEKGYGPATQVRWLQDQQKMPVRSNFPNANSTSFHYQNTPPQQKRPRYEPQ